MAETKRIIVRITLPDESGWTLEDVCDELESALSDVADYTGAVVEFN